MLRQLCISVLTVTWIVGMFVGSFGDYLVEPVVCTNVSVNFLYQPPLPAASTGQKVTTVASDSGVWYPCQLGSLRTSISYYMTLTATNANCEKATFSNFIFTGFFNCTAIGEQPARSKNLTVPLSDSKQARSLDQVQTFLGPIIVPFSVNVPCLGSISTPINVQVPFFGSLYAVNFTFIFPPNNHQPNTCGEVQSEKVQIIPQLYLINLPNYAYTPIIPPILAECK